MDSSRGCLSASPGLPVQHQSLRNAGKKEVMPMITRNNRRRRFAFDNLESRQFFSVAPAAPSDLAATAMTGTSASFVGPVQPTTPSVMLNWHDNSSDETGFLVTRSIDGTTF